MYMGRVWYHSGECSMVPLTRTLTEQCVTDAGVTAGRVAGQEEQFFKAGKPGEAWKPREVLRGTGRSSRQLAQLITLLSPFALLSESGQTPLPGSLSSGVFYQPADFPRPLTPPARVIILELIPRKAR